MLLGGHSEKLDQTTPQRHCPWHADGAPTLGLSARRPAALTQGPYVPDVVLLESSWSWTMEVGLRYPTVGGTYSYGKFKRKKDEELCCYIFIVS
jgi:hypothetical protein